MQNEMIFRNLPPQEILQLLIGVAKRLTDSRVLLVLHVLEITCKDQIKSDCEASSVARSSAATFRAGHFLTENRSPNRAEPNRKCRFFGFRFRLRFLFLIYRSFVNGFGFLGRGTEEPKEPS